MTTGHMTTTPPKPPPDPKQRPAKRKPGVAARPSVDQTNSTNENTASHERLQPSQRPSQLNGKKLPESAQQNVLCTLCFSDSEAGAEVASRVVPSDFGEPYSEIAAKALEYRGRYGKAPGAAHTADLFADMLRDPKSERGQIFLRILTSLFRLWPNLNEKFVADQFGEFIRQQALLRAMVSGLERLKQGGDGTAEEIEVIFARAFEQSRKRVDPPRLESWSASLALTEPPPPRQWVLGTTALAGALSVLVGPGGVGKSALAIVMALSVAVGRGLCGDFAFQRRRVLYVSLEDDADELKRRIAAAMQHHDIVRGEVDGWLYVATVNDGAVIAKATPKGDLVPGDLFERLRAEIAEKQIGFLTVDPLVHAHELDENSSRDMSFLARLFVQLATETGAAILAVHHTRKGPAQGGDADVARGSSALVNAARMALTLSTMSKDDATKLLVPEEERRGIVRLDGAKANMAPPEKARWYRLVSVTLGNSDETYKNGDKVQAVETWTPSDVFKDDDLQENIEPILAEIEKGMPDGERYSDDARAQTRAAWRLVQQFCPEKNEQECRAIIRGWMKSGALVRRNYASPTRRGNPEVVGLYRKAKPDAAQAEN